MQAARRSARLHLVGVDEAGHASRRSRPCSRDQRQHAAALWPVAEDHAAQSPGARARPRSRGRGRAPASRGCGGRRTPPTGSAGSRLARLERAGVLALEHRGARREGRLRRSRCACRREKQNARWGTRSAERLHGVPTRAAGSARGTRASSRASTPRASRPRGGSRAGAARAGGRAARSRGTRRCARRRSGARAQQMPEHARPNTSGGRMRRRPARVQRHARARRRPRHARHLAALAPLPLAQRQVGDLVPLRGEPLAEVAVPALGAADGVGETGSRRPGRSASRRAKARRPFATIAAQHARLLPSSRVHRVRPPAYPGSIP